MVSCRWRHRVLQWPSSVKNGSGLVVDVDVFSDVDWWQKKQFFSESQTSGYRAFVVEPSKAKVETLLSDSIIRTS